MKEYFIRLFNYDQYANQLIRQTMVAACNPKKCVQLMAHLLAAQQVWLARCKAEPAFTGALWPDGDIGVFEAMIDGNHLSWIDFLNKLGEADFEKKIAYKNSKGESFENMLSDILTHVINHGTHHRAQIGQHLILAGTEKLPGTDYILYIRNLPAENHHV